MTLCLKRLPKLKTAKTVDCCWVWTEEHSMRLKLKLTVQKEVVTDCIMQQSFLVEFVVKNRQCVDCNATFNNMSWKASVQVRQRVNHKRTFFYLEQLILKKNAQAKAVKIEQFRDGLDFFFKEKNDAMRFSKFLEDQVPCKNKATKKLVSADLTSNLFHHQYTSIVELAPACKDDLILLTASEARRLGDLSRVALVKTVNAGRVKLVDPTSGHLGDLDAHFYFKTPPIILLAGSMLEDFVVLDVEVRTYEAEKQPRPQLQKKMTSSKATKKRRRNGDSMPSVRDDFVSRSKTKIARGFVADVTLARSKDLGTNDDKVHCVTHLGALLRTGDIVKGYDLRTANFTGDVDDTHLKNVPDVVLVRKHLPDQHSRRFKLKALDYDEDDDEPLKKKNTEDNKDYETFLDQLQTDKDMRSHVNLYKQQSEIKTMNDEDDDDLAPAPEADPDALDLNELLEDLDIAADKDKEEEEEWPAVLTTKADKPSKL